MSADALRGMYREVWPSIAALPTDQGLSFPLFVALPESFPTAKLRLLYVGQETFSWYGFLGQEMGDDPVGKVLDCYRDFNLGHKYRSPFWATARRLRRLLGTATEPVEFAWSNLYPCDQRKRRPAEPLSQALLGLRLLPREVTIVKPHAVVFVTGPNYDGALTTLFPGAQFRDPGTQQDQWVHRVEHSDLPTASYRTYHPAYLRRKKLGAVIDTIAGLIKASLAPPTPTR